MRPLSFERQRVTVDLLIPSSRANGRIPNVSMTICAGVFMSGNVRFDAYECQEKYFHESC
jgi:hypothetical protein